MSQIKLSFCIATLNRAALIGETLESIVSQSDEYVEIVIVDGASTDNTADVVGTYQARFPNLVYRRLPEKGGVDKDYSISAEMARGEYCWFMSDDDVLKPGAVAAVLNAILNRYALIVVNAEVRTADLSGTIGAQILPFTTDQIYPAQDDERFFYDACTYMSFIGCVVIRREFWNQRAKKPYLGSEFVHVGVIFQAPRPGDALIIACPWIMIRYNNASWSSRYFEIWMFKWPRVVWSFERFSAGSRNHVALKDPWRRPKVLLINRARGAYSLREYHKFLEERLTTRHDRMVARSFALLPGWLINASLLLYYHWFKKSEILVVEDLRNSPHYLPKRWKHLWQG